VGVGGTAGGGSFDVELAPLELVDGRLRFGPARMTRLPAVDGDGFGDLLLPGDDVAVHWDRVCGRLDSTAAARLSAVTERNLAVANTTL
jgi:hypothetical protein